MKKYVIFLIICFLMLSCIEEPDYFIEYKITNNTNYSIKFEFYPNNSIESFILSNGSEKIFSDHARGSFNDFFPFESIDSIKVTFDENIDVIHNSHLYNLQRNIIKKENFQIIKNESNYREYNYELENADYLEALSHQ